MKSQTESGLFAKNLAEVMQALGMTQAHLARQTGMSRAHVSLILSGKREPGLSMILRILDVIPIKFERLVQK